jgi:hypothetical protein
LAELGAAIGVKPGAVSHFLPLIATFDAMWARDRRQENETILDPILAVLGLKELIRFAILTQTAPVT